MKVTASITLEGNDYVVSSSDAEIGELERFDRSRMGDQVAREQAETYAKAYEAGYSQAVTDYVD